MKKVQRNDDIFSRSNSSNHHNSMESEDEEILSSLQIEYSQEAQVWRNHQLPNNFSSDDEESTASYTRKKNSTSKRHRIDTINISNIPSITAHINTTPNILNNSSNKNPNLVEISHSSTNLSTNLDYSSKVVLTQTDHENKFKDNKNTETSIKFNGPSTNFNKNLQTDITPNVIAQKMTVNRSDVNLEMSPKDRREWMNLHCNPVCDNCMDYLEMEIDHDQSPVMSRSCHHTIFRNCLFKSVLANRMHLCRKNVHSCPCPVHLCKAKNAFNDLCINYNVKLIELFNSIGDNIYLN